MKRVGGAHRRNLRQGTQCNVALVVSKKLYQYQLVGRTQSPTQKKGKSTSRPSGR